MVRIYTVENCPYCTELKGFLTNEGVEYHEVNVNLPENSEEYKKLHDFTKCDEVPIVRVGNQILVPNVSFSSIREAVDLTKKFLI